MSKEVKLALIVAGGFVIGGIVQAMVQPMVMNMINKNNAQAMINAEADTEG